ncbi:phosphatase PAP2 family protein [Clavibacter michiganensis]|uniref:Phosphatidic acid phosphatase n=2 Tax=Clavibacter michiganensis subsp. insidiosus TaxID=33014 RepID=A0A0D5CF56_9MICO|nr:phosphatase PAP2 family protein [Clavibacter michiganensis]AJW77887.1 phosphatidic acid phosphatase [Clavibacter michiganensis subsp. insidiosus]AWF97049.1 phosphatidic acid phosphatase [Clavibacter michiganensis subsp. insidiosus]AWG00117.1 phosphatidic acid phosphatase [Clavibacter michiganensis subsp. insidiosus]OQJ58528.1 phosphatidic acid phosphatase [Clavibacter michiganensis subsp. insidiosus]RII88555.1 PAP2 family protein [Clavibacter michiganensis subsp. insidiosus]
MSETPRRRPLDPLDPADQRVAGELRRDRYLGARDLTRWATPVGRALVRLVQRIVRALGPYAALVITLLVGLVLAFGLAAIAAQVYDNVTDADGVAGLDKPLLVFMIGIRTPWLNDAATAYTDVAGVVVMPIIAVVTMLFLAVRRRSWTPIILVLAAGGGSLLLTIAGKDIIDRARPDLADAVPPYETSPSFPSGHTLNAVAIAGILAYLLLLRQHRRATRVLSIAVAVVFAVTIGATRVYLGHHWFTDVLAAFFLGGAWLALVITAHRLYLTARRPEAVEAGLVR